MKFLETILPSLRVWQFFCLSPFGLDEKTQRPKVKRIFNAYCIAYIAVESAVLVHGIVFPDYYLERAFTIVLVYGDFVTMTLARLLAILIVVESWVKRPMQIDFLERINKVDSILVYRLNIDLPYKANRRETSCKSIAWLLTFTAMQIVFLSLLIADPFSKRMLRFWLSYMMSFFICTLRYHQMVTYVRLLRYRFAALNDYIQSVCLLNERPNINQDLLMIMTSVGKSLPVKPDPDARKTFLYQKLIEVRTAYQSLFEASEEFNVLFRWTLPINIANDFQKGLTNIFFFLTISLQWDTSKSSNPMQLPRPLIWGAYNIGHILVLSSACQHAREVAELTPALLHQIDFNVKDHRLADLVGSNISHMSKVKTNVFCFADSIIFSPTHAAEGQLYGLWIAQR